MGGANFKRDPPLIMAAKKGNDSLLSLDAKEEGELPETLKRNLLLEVFIYLFLLQFLLVL